MSDALAQQTLASTVIETLSEVRSKDGDDVAYRLASSNIEASTLFLLHAIGPQAARRALFAAVTAMENAFKFTNANSEYLQ